MNFIGVRELLAAETYPRNSLKRMHYISLLAEQANIGESLASSSANRENIASMATICISFYV